MSIDVSVIIPTYNVEKYIYKALTSVKNQNFDGKIEIIVIDDCSTDNTPQMLASFKQENPELNIKIIYQEKNMRQGTARNKGLTLAEGKYIFFLDGDDFLDPDAISKMFEKAEEYSCDFVICDWVYYYEGKGLVYVNNDEFLCETLLIGKEVESLYKAETYFTVNKLYKKEFLINNNIKYGEGYIYEDFEFYIQVTQKADVVGVINNPLYRVRVNEHSTTKTNTNSSIHVESLIKAVENTLIKFNPRSQFSYYHVYKYLIKKTLFYLEYRAPHKYRRKALRQVVNMLNNKKKDYPVPTKVIPLYHFLFRRKYLQNNDINKILFIWWLYKKKKLNDAFLLALKIKWAILDTKIAKNLRKKRNAKKIESFYKRPIKNNMILFLGFDYRYTGNSKYLFDFIKQNKDFEVYFVTNDVRVPAKHRVRPRSMEFYEKLAQAKFVFIESWVPLKFKKRKESVWIQLWHGTPFKKLFFDSHEYFISSFNKNHKRDKHQDIRRWDYLLADSTGGMDKLSSAFAFDKDKIFNFGYPRVQWLIQQNNNSDLKRKIKKSLYIPLDKKVLLYAPTWRDYNYKKSQYDFSYLLNLNVLEKELSKEFVIVYKPHSMETSANAVGRIIIPNEDVDIQELILISDVIVSDYSSTIFDALAIDKPFYLYINDLDKYSHARGIYKDLEELLKPLFVDSEEELVKKITNLDNEYPFEQLQKLKELYAHKRHDSCKLIEDKLYEILQKNKVT